MQIVDDESIKQQVDEFGTLSEEISSLTAQLKKIEQRHKELGESLLPLLERLEDAEEQVLRAEKYILTILSKSYERTNYKYKEAFELALTKVNSATKAILEEALQTTQTTTKIGGRLKAIRIHKESISSTVKAISTKLNSAVQSAVTSINRSYRSLDKGVESLGKLSKL